MENPNDPIRNRTRDLPAPSALPHPPAPPRTPCANSNPYTCWYIQDVPPKGHHSPSSHNSLVTATEGKSKENWHQPLFCHFACHQQIPHNQRRYTVLFALSRVILCSKRFLKSSHASTRKNRTQEDIVTISH
jgi:hypothetical protein